ncbi:hypothetical protein L3X38_036113 [Prunus dulcis]|uniref:Uncharacterized protein n=1 Tax=Prunus dulcis TaxID=3755 RepID=A0AAD4V288_PRUDU|nr:hypothetical protein L3X38_036113 [Prunus dulcis]
MPLRYEDVDPLSPSRNQNKSMWVSVGEGKNREGLMYQDLTQQMVVAFQHLRCQTPRQASDERKAQLNRLVKLREKLQLEELELTKADVVASLEVAAAEERKIRRQ